MSLRYLIRRIALEFVPTFFLLSIIVFSLMHLAPGDPISTMLSPEAPAYVVDAIRTEYNLDKPLAIQYILWLRNIFNGNLGRSIRSRESVFNMIISRLPVTFYLASLAMLLTVLISIPAGIVAAVKRGTIIDKIVMVLTSLALSFPDFFTSILLVLLVGAKLKWLPMSGYTPLFEDFFQSLSHMIMPAFALCLIYIGLLTRLVRSDMLDVMDSDYIRTARAKGTTELRVLFKHALRNTLVPALTLTTMNYAVLLGGTVIIESIFALPGMGRLVIRAMYDRDFPVIQGIVLVVGVFFLCSSLLSDFLAAFVDPRIRIENLES